LTVNGTATSKLFLTWEAIATGATLSFDLTSAPTGWGTAAADAPPSF
jgi:putative alpha-1,2-mannosidase